MKDTRNARGYISLQDAVRHPIDQVMYGEMSNRVPLRPLFIGNVEDVVNEMYREQPRLKGVITLK